MRQSPTWTLMRAVPGLREQKSRFHLGPALWLDETEIAHAHSDGSADLRLTRTAIREFIAELQGNPNVRFRRSRSSDWIEVKLQSPDAERFLIDLVEIAIDRNRLDGRPGEGRGQRRLTRRLNDRDEDLGPADSPDRIRPRSGGGESPLPASSGGRKR